MALTEEDLQALPPEGIDTSNPGIYTELLSDLQGNILRGHGRDHSVDVFLKFKSGQVQAVKEWIRNLSEQITSAQKQADEAVRYRNERIPGELFVTFYLSRRGYEYLGFRPFQIPGDQAFRFGMKDPSVRNLLADPVIETWDTGLKEEIHALLLVADDNLELLKQKVEEIITALAPLAEVIQQEEGFLLRNEKGDIIEHFGFVDGISQPLFLKRDIEKAQLNSDFSKWDSRAPLSLVLAKDPNGKLEDSYGSYLVYRKLEQNVAAFSSAEQFLANKLGIDQELAGALMMGRFKDGTPVTLSNVPEGTLTNNFNFDEDQQGSKCPFHAHVRKSNPRGDTGRTGTSGESYEQSLETERGHRIARRAVSYGTNDLTQKPETGSGLLFLCFQANINNQFHFMQGAWANANNFVQVNVGVDPIIGQTPAGATRNQKWPLEWGQSETVDGFNFDLWVHLKGGEYFFAPSISCLKSMS